MFKISRRLDYGLQLMIALAADTEGRPQPSAQLAKKLQIPLPFLHQIAHTLMQSGLIKASPGPRGGLRINPPAEKITVLRIAEVLEGPIVLTPCLDSSDSCPRSEACSTQCMWKTLQDNIVEYLGNVNLAQLLACKDDQANFLLQLTPSEKTPTTIAAD
ncbi:MAG TPA: Rrf2 family transcriptional regulator [Chloroflexi bacterium]|nr:Rrf2 family transcriptional regulator [Chloroflexota bacterium]